MEAMEQNQLGMIAVETDCSYELNELQDGDEIFPTVATVLTQSQHALTEEELQIIKEIEEEWDLYKC